MINNFPDTAGQSVVTTGTSRLMVSRIPVGSPWKYEGKTSAFACLMYG